MNLFAVPFPLICIFTTTIGFGNALTQAAANVVCGEMPYAMLALSFAHGRSLEIMFEFSILKEIFLNKYIAEEEKKEIIYLIIYYTTI